MAKCTARRHHAGGEVSPQAAAVVAFLEVAVSAFLEMLKAKYPDKEFSMDPVSGTISWVTNETCCQDPFLMDDGRFVCTANFHGLDTEDATALYAHNLRTGAC